MRQGFRNRMMLPRVHRVASGGRVLRYHRPTKTRLPDLPEDHPDFIAAWAAAEAGGQPPRGQPGTLARLVEETCAGRRFRDLARAYAAMMTAEMVAIRAAYGPVAVAGLRPRHIMRDIAPLAPHKAHKRLRAWRLVFAHALAIGQIEVDPSAGVRKPAARPGGHVAWSAAEMARFRARWPIGTTARAAFELVAWTAARVSDAATLSRAHIGDDGILSFRQAKTGGWAHVPWTCPLPPWAARWHAERETMHAALARTAGGFTLLEAAGRARSVKGLSNLIAGAAREAGIEARSAHGLRKTRLTAIAEAGGTTQAIMAWGGHSSLSEAERYTRSVSRKSMVAGTAEEQEAVNPAAISVNPAG